VVPAGDHPDLEELAPTVVRRPAELAGIDLDAILRSPLEIDESARPIFVVGCVRSGLRVIQEALAAAGIPAGSRVGFGGLLRRLLDEVDRQYRNLDPEYLADKAGNLIANTDEDAVRSFIVNSLGGLLPPAREGEDLASTWSERLPEFLRTAPAVRSVPDLARLYPRARFVYVARRGIECVLSCHRNFGLAPAFQHFCWVWQDAIHAWGEVREQVAGRYLEIHQHRSALEPEVVAEQLAEFLELGSEMTAPMAAVLGSRRPGRSCFLREDRWIGLEETGWPAWQQKLFTDLCKSMMDAAEYPLEATVLAEPRPLEIFFPEDGTGVSLHAVGEGGFREADDGAIELVANPPGSPPAAVRYPRVPLGGEDRLEARIEAPGEAAGPVNFRARLEDAEGNTVAAIAGSLAPGASEDLQVTFPPAYGWHDLVIAADSPAAGSSFVRLRSLRVLQGAGSRRPA
jgi:hypothetical protein